MRFPLWLKIFGTLVLISIALTLIQAVSYDLIGPVLVLIPLIFAGKNKDNPTMVWVIPWFWGLEIAGSLFFLFLALTGKPFPGEDARPPTMPEIISAIVLLPPLIWLLVTRHVFFKPLLVGSTVIFVGLSFWVYGTSLGDGKAKLELASDLFTQAVITIYLFKKVRAPAISPSPQQ